MPPYKEPALGDRLGVKYVRIGEDIFVGRSEYHDSHGRIAKLDYLEARIAQLKLTDPTEVDAGWVGVRRDSNITIAGNSAMLDLPVASYADVAREITLKDFAEQSPEHNVIGYRK
jgi:hypothetical protein